MKLREILIGVLFLGAFPLRAEMIQGSGFSFFLSAPAGWVLDKTMASEAESDAVLYPQGTTYQNAPSVLYVSVMDKGGGFKGLADLEQQDEASARQNNPRFHLQSGPLLQTQLKKNVPVLLYLGLKDGSGEAVAYVEEAEAVVVFTLASTNEQILHEDLPALQASVESYEFMGKSAQTP